MKHILRQAHFDVYIVCRFKGQKSESTEGIWIKRTMYTYTHLQILKCLMTLWWKYKFRTPIHTAHTKFLCYCCWPCECVFILAGSVDVCCLGSGDYHYKILVHRVLWNTCTTGCYTFLCIYLIQFSLFILSMSRSLAHSFTLYFVFSLCERASEWVSICVYACLSVYMYLRTSNSSRDFFSWTHFVYRLR